MGRGMIDIFLSLITEMSDNAMTAKYKCSINEIIEKTNVTEKEILELLEKGIIKGKAIFGVPFIINDTPYSVEKKLKDYKEDKNGNSKIERRN